MKKLYKVTLTPEERNALVQLVSVGKCNAQKIKHANILLAVDETTNRKTAVGEVAKQFHCHTNTVANIRQRFVEEGLEAALERKKVCPLPRHLSSTDAPKHNSLNSLAPLRPKDDVDGPYNSSPIHASNETSFPTHRMTPSGVF